MQINSSWLILGTTLFGLELATAQTATANLLTTKQFDRNPIVGNLSYELLPKSLELHNHFHNAIEDKLIKPKTKLLLTQNSSVDASDLKPENLSDLNPDPNPLKLPDRPQQVQIQKTVALTLKQAIELAKRNNRTLRVTKLQLERNRAQLREQEAALFPSLGLEGGVRRELNAQGELASEAQRRQAQQQIDSIPQIEAQLARTTNVAERVILQSQLQQLRQQENQLDDIDNFATTTINGTINLRYAILSPERQASINAAAEQLRVSELEVEKIEEQLRLDIANAYYDLQQADREVLINQRDVASRSSSLKNIQILLKNKLATRSDLLSAQVELDNAIQLLRNSQAQQQTAQRTLAQLLSLPSSVNPIAADKVAIGGEWNLSLERTIVLALKNRVELEQRLAERRGSQAQRQIALAAIRPQVALVANYDLLQAYSDEPGENVPRGFADGYSFGLTVNWTLFDGGAASAQARQAEADIAIAEQQFADSANQIRLEVEQAYFQLPSTFQNVKTATQSLERAKEAVKAEQIRFQANVNTQTEVLNAQNRLVQAENNLIQAILGYNRALAALQRAVGKIKK